jgi:flagellar basal-body rod protein FlgB
MVGRKGKAAMDLQSTPLFSALAGRLKHLTARAGVIAENIANADTPDFAARDIASPAAPRMAAALKATDPRHFTAAPATSGGARVIAAPDAEASINGNRVSLETQMMKMSETRMDYQLASTVYRKSVELLRFAARGGR